MQRTLGVKSQRDEGGSSSAGGGGASPAGGAAAPAAAAGSRPPGSQLPRLTLANLSTFATREKPLPPDADTAKAIHTRLLQFSDPVRFACAKCRRDNIESDCVAVDATSRVMLCTRCFARLVRPRTYRPTRVVPFPSLLSWLQYRPAEAADAVSADVLQRPGEAAAPSESRVAAPRIDGGRATPLDRLPAIATRTLPTAAPPGSRAYQQQQHRGGGGGAGRRGGGGSVSAGHSGPLSAAASGALEAPEETHPCLRVWGFCEHGATCHFRNAPRRLCLAYLMGLCDGSGANGCALTHEAAYRLPASVPPHPATLYRGDLQREESEWARWVAARKASTNSAEWQLWNNGPIGGLVHQYVPAQRPPPPPPPPPTAAGAAAEAASENEEKPPLMEEGEGDKKEEVEEKEEEVQLNVADILSALRGIDPQ